MNKLFIVFEIRVMLVEMVLFDLPLLMKQWVFLYSMSVFAKIVFKLYSILFVRDSILRSTPNQMTILPTSVALKMDLVGF